MADQPAVPDEHDKPHAPGGNPLNKTKAEDADRVIPRPEETPESGTSPDPEKVRSRPDDSTSLPRPL
jgi:hypothetical protein